MKTQRRPRKKTKAPSEAAKDKYYFTADTQAAIVEFQSEIDIDKRASLYVTRIEPALRALVDNLIRINKFEGLFKTREELRHDCITFLYETLRKFDNTRGSAAFSYFNVVAKNWLTVSSRARAQRAKKMISIDSDPAKDSAKAVINQRITPGPDQESDIPNLNKMLELIESQRDEFSESENRCFDAIMQMCADPEIVADAKRTHILAALKGLAGQGRDFASGMNKLRARYRAIREADER